MDTVTLIATGLLTGIGLIAAVGAQNAYLLRQGLRRQHVGPLVVLCAASDVVLIGLAVLGVGAAVQEWPAFLDIARWGGGIFVIGYGLHVGWRALRPGAGLVAGAGGGQLSLRRALTTMAALTWLNPHLYLDVIVLGSIANTHGPDGRWWYYAGLIAASGLWFGLLGFGSRVLAPLLSRPRSWQVLDGLIALVMLAIGVALITG
ncbi:amino acid transporter [Serinicoccus sp. CUA-874]|uniref:LysE/ArgO family amino acid transporter n=1 Tax=Serinicoccus TaxID=265976 RepID=UPI00096910BA|nr:MULTISPECIES: LysE/ArgO family amino acid transporter [Serinicoccus]OLT15002.1 amino acid transporter [Serinicoccus sp. CUA-874]OLT34803.1 amino acid transporter [Kytococcus sp. CUA-901]